MSIYHVMRPGEPATEDAVNALFSNLFFNKFENREKFNIVGKEFEAKGTIIKTIDTDKNTMNTSLRCDLLNHKDISERREEIIDVVLNNEQNNNIIKKDYERRKNFKINGRR